MQAREERVIGSKLSVTREMNYVGVWCVLLKHPERRTLAGEELLGLARGFLSAGARSLILSLWTVNDDATSRLMTELYQNLQRGQSIAASLRVAQLKFIENREHPYFWAPFFLIA